MDRGRKNTQKAKGPGMESNEPSRLRRESGSLKYGFLVPGFIVLVSELQAFLTKLTVAS